MELLKNIRAYEDVYFEDPEENPDTPRFRVWFDDKHIEEYLAKVGNAIDRAQANEQMAREADTPEKVAEANAAQARLMKRTVSTFIGTEAGRSCSRGWAATRAPSCRRRTSASWARFSPRS